MGFDLDLADEALHPPGDTPLWRESVWLDAYDPERGVGLVVYAHARPVTAEGDVFAIVLLPDGRRAVYDVHGASYAERHEGNVMRVDGLRSECTTAGSSVKLQLESASLSLGLAFEANGPIYDYDWESWTNSRHFEQFGAVTGSIATPEGQVEFDGLGTRDHAWGARAKVPWRRWIWMTARFPGDKGWGVCLVDASEPKLLGYVSEDPPRALTFAQLDMELDGAAKVTGATIELVAAERDLRAHIRPLADIDRAGTDPTKKGGYDYYLVEVDDEEFGRGYGLLDVFSAPEFDPRDSGAVAAGSRPTRSSS